MSQPSNPRQLNEVETSAGALLQPMRFVGVGFHSLYPQDSVVVKWIFFWD